MVLSYGINMWQKDGSHHRQQEQKQKQEKEQEQKQEQEEIVPHPLEVPPWGGGTGAAHPGGQGWTSEDTHRLEVPPMAGVEPPPHWRASSLAAPSLLTAGATLDSHSSRKVDVYQPQDTNT